MEKRVLILCAVAAAASLVVGILIGHFAIGKGGGGGGRGSRAEGQTGGGGGGHRGSRQFDSEQAMIADVIRDVDTKRLRSYLKFLSDQPHIAAQERDERLTEWMMREWEDAGLDKVKLATYDFYLSWPNQTNPNKVFLLDGNGRTKFTSRHKEEELREGDDSPDFIHAFNG